MGQEVTMLRKALEKARALAEEKDAAAAAKIRLVAELQEEIKRLSVEVVLAQSSVDIMFQHAGCEWLHDLWASSMTR